jgi:hypothetical protein
MKRLNYQKIVIYSFVSILITGGCLTVILHLKPIAQGVMAVVKQEWEDKSDMQTLANQTKDSLEQGITGNMFAKEMYIDWYGFVEKIAGRRYIRDTNPSNVVVKDNHDFLQFITFKADSTKKAEELAEIKAQLDQKDIPLLFVQTPLKIIEDFTVLPEAVEDYSNSNTDAFLKALDEKVIDYLDLRQAAEEDQLDKASLFFRTDHHWRNETAFWAVEKVVEKLKQDYDIVLDEDNFYTDKDNYELTTYEQSFLGSQGRRVGKYYAGIDDYNLITPNFDTKYRVTINKSDTSTVYTGDFSEAILHQTLLGTSKSVYTNRYATYFGGDYPEVIIKNEAAPNDKKILIIKDSFALPFTAFLSTMTSEIRMLDLRYYEAEQLQQYIETFEPNNVLYVYKSINTQ